MIAMPLVNDNSLAPVWKLKYPFQGLRVTIAYQNVKYKSLLKYYSLL